MRRITSFILVLLMTFSLVSCSDAKNVRTDSVIPPVPKDGKLELTILVNSQESNDLYRNSWLAGYIGKFKRDFGVDIKIEEIKSANISEGYDEYLKKLFIRLVTDDGPDLIYSHYINMEPLVEQQAVVDLRGKVANIDRIYNSLLSNEVYYVPLGVDYIGMKVNRDAIAELGIEKPVMDWTRQDYYAARNKWTLKHNILFNAYEYDIIFWQFIDVESLYNAKDKKVVLNTPEVRQRINNMRDYVFGGTYKLIDGYKYENYYNMLYEDESKERQNDKKTRGSIYSNGHIDGGGVDNLFRAKSLEKWIKEFAIIRDSRNMSRGELLDSFGFLVNKNGKNLDIAYEFINGLLNNEVQMSMFKNEDEYFAFYPVNKDIEEDILKLESEAGLDPRAIQVKALALQELKEGKCGLWTTKNLDIYKLEGMIKQDLTKLILADNPYSDEQLQVELKRMEDKYNIYLNE